MLTFMAMWKKQIWKNQIFLLRDIQISESNWILICTTECLHYTQYVLTRNGSYIRNASKILGIFKKRLEDLSSYVMKLWIYFSYKLRFFSQKEIKEQETRNRGHVQHCLLLEHIAWKYPVPVLKNRMKYEAYFTVHV